MHTCDDGACVKQAETFSFFCTWGSLHFLQRSFSLYGQVLFYYVGTLSTFYSKGELHFLQFSKECLKLEIIVLRK